MNSLEMYNSVLQGLDAVGAFTVDYYEPYEIAGFLNKMQNRFIKNRYYMLSNDKGKGFEQNQKRLADLYTLVTVESYADSSTFPSSRGSAVLLDLPFDFMLMINMSASVTYNSMTKADCPVDIVEQEFLYHTLSNPFAMPKKFVPKAVVQDYTVKIFPGKMSLLNSAQMTYLRHPRQMEIYLPTVPGETPETLVNCELPEHTHDEIVDMTIKHILEVIASPRYQSNSFENKQSE